VALSFIEPFGYSHGWRDIVNSASFDVEERRPDNARSVVWQSDDSISLAIGQSATVQAKASDPFMDALDLVLGTDIVFTGPGTIVSTISRHSGQSTTITVLAVGGAVDISHLQLRARSVPVVRTVKVSADDATSIQRHGLRSYPDDVPWANQHDAYGIALLLLAHYAQRRPTVQLRIVSSDDEHMMQILTRTISDLISIAHAELGLSADFHIESIEHSIERMPGEEEAVSGCEIRVHHVTLGCERTGAMSVPANPFTFDVPGLGFDDGVFDPTAADNPDTVFIFDHPTQGAFDIGKFGT